MALDLERSFLLDLFLERRQVAFGENILDRLAGAADQMMVVRQAGYLITLFIVSEIDLDNHSLLQQKIYFPVHGRLVYLKPFFCEKFLDGRHVERLLQAKQPGNDNFPDLGLLKSPLL